MTGDFESEILVSTEHVVRVETTDNQTQHTHAQTESDSNSSGRRFGNQVNGTTNTELD